MQLLAVDEGATGGYGQEEKTHRGVGGGVLAELSCRWLGKRAQWRRYLTESDGECVEHDAGETVAYQGSAGEVAGGAGMSSRGCVVEN